MTFLVFWIEKSATITANAPACPSAMAAAVPTSGVGSDDFSAF